MPNVWGNIIWELMELAFLGPFLASKIILVKIRVSCKVNYMFYLTQLAAKFTSILPNSPQYTKYYYMLYLTQLAAKLDMFNRFFSRCD